VECAPVERELADVDRVVIGFALGDREALTLELIVFGFDGVETDDLDGIE